MNTFLHLPFPSRPRHDSLVRISYFSTCFQNRLLFRLTANLDTRMKTWEVFPYENVITVIFSHIATRSIVRFFQRFALMQSTPSFDFFRKIRDENTLKVKKKNDLRRLQFKQLQKEAWKKFQFSTGFGPLSPRHQFTRTN